MSTPQRLKLMDVDVDRLHLITGNQTYLDWSIKTYNWWSSWGFDSTGKTWDTISLQCTEGGGTLERLSYNSGSALFLVITPKD